MRFFAKFKLDDPLQFLAQPVHRLLGGQRPAALKVGLLGAYVGRAAMLVLANFVIQNDWLKILGALYLIKLAFENLVKPKPVKWYLSQRGYRGKAKD